MTLGFFCRFSKQTCKSSEVEGSRGVNVWQTKTGKGGKQTNGKSLFSAQSSDRTVCEFRSSTNKKVIMKTRW